MYDLKMIKDQFKNNFVVAIAHKIIVIQIEINSYMNFKKTLCKFKQKKRKHSIMAQPNGILITTY